MYPPPKISNLLNKLYPRKSIVSGIENNKLCKNLLFLLDAKNALHIYVSVLYIYFVCSLGSRLILNLSFCKIYNIFYIF